MKTIDQTVGDNLKKLREFSDFTQAKLADAIGVKRSTYSNYENGARETPYEIIEKTSNLLGCEPYLFFEDNLQAENEMFVSTFRVKDIDTKDLEEIAKFRDAVMSYLKMERIAQDEAK